MYLVRLLPDHGVSRHDRSANSAAFESEPSTHCSVLQAVQLLPLQSQRFRVDWVIGLLLTNIHRFTAQM